eukprot:5419564-Prymnesium_polylepis.1
MPSPSKLPTVRSQTNFSAPPAQAAGRARVWRRRGRVQVPSPGAAHAPACAASSYTEPPRSSPPFA